MTRRGWGVQGLPVPPKAPAGTRSGLLQDWEQPGYIDVPCCSGLRAACDPPQLSASSLGLCGVPRSSYGALRKNHGTEYQNIYLPRYAHASYSAANEGGGDLAGCLPASLVLE
eukprot:23832-Eustigmatos_ZCMA.PRE.1